MNYACLQKRALQIAINSICVFICNLQLSEAKVTLFVHGPDLTCLSGRFYRACGMGLVPRVAPGARLPPGGGSGAGRGPGSAPPPPAPPAAWTSLFVRRRGDGRSGAGLCALGGRAARLAAFLAWHGFCMGDDCRGPRGARGPRDRRAGRARLDGAFARVFAGSPDALSPRSSGPARRARWRKSLSRARPPQAPQISATRSGPPAPRPGAGRQNGGLPAPRQVKRSL